MLVSSYLYLVAGDSSEFNTAIILFSTASANVGPNPPLVCEAGKSIETNTCFLYLRAESKGKVNWMCWEVKVTLPNR